MSGIPANPESMPCWLNMRVNPLDMDLQGRPQPGSTSTQASALLHCLSQLNSDVWAQVLLPKLVEQGSAAAVALTCSQLRDLCYNSRQEIKVRLSHMVASVGLSHLESCMQSVPAHFPNCTSVSLVLSGEQSYHAMPYTLPALARLRHLNQLSVTLAGDVEPATFLLATTTLYSLRMQLHNLQALAISLVVNGKAQSAGPWFDAEHLHCELGRATQLTRLSLGFCGMKDQEDLKYPAVVYLSGLTQLQHLAICAQGWHHDERLRRYHFYDCWPVLTQQLLSSLTALTWLESNLCDVESLSAVSSCVNLQHLAVCVSGRVSDMGAEQWACLAPLTRLTQLRLLGAECEMSSPEACDTLSKLTGLQVVAASRWCPDYLPALAGCVQLTEICGGWISGRHRPDIAPPRAGVALPHVLVLSGKVGHAPPQCFPNLSAVLAGVSVDGMPMQFDNAVSLEGLQSMCKHCTGLRELDLTAFNSSFDYLQEDSSEDDDGDTESTLGEAAALQSLTSLQHLTCLKFAPSEDFVLLSLVQACCVLEGHSLRELHVMQGHGQRYDVKTSAAAWMQLGQLRQLHKLVLVVTRYDLHDSLAKDEAVFLAGLSHSRHVLLKLTGSLDPFVTALEEMKEVGIWAPRVTLEHCES